MSLSRYIYKASPAFLRRLAWGVMDRLGPVAQTVKTGPAKGMKIVAPLRRRMNFCYGTHEPHVTQAIEHHVPCFGSAIDIGAFLGAHTLSMAAQTGSRGRVFAFEPYSENADLLERTLEINQLSWVQSHRLALGNRNQRMQMTGAKSSMMRTSDLQADTSIENKNMTDMVRLDDKAEIANSINRLDFIKVDVEGGELAALKGMEYLIKRYHPVIVCELTLHPYVAYQPGELTDWLSAHDYELSILPDTEQSVGSHIDKIVQKRKEDTNLGTWYVTHLLAR